MGMLKIISPKVRPWTYISDCLCHTLVVLGTLLLCETFAVCAYLSFFLIELVELLQLGTVMQCMGVHPLFKSFCFLQNIKKKTKLHMMVGASVCFASIIQLIYTFNTHGLM